MRRSIARWQPIVVTLLIAGLLFGLLPPPSAAAADTTVAVAPATRAVAVGETFTLGVVVQSEQPVRGYQFGVTFNPAVVKVNSVTAGNWLQSWADANGAVVLLFPPWAIDNTNGSVSVGGNALMGGPDSGPTGSGTLATISLTALADGVSPVDLNTVVVAGLNGVEYPVVLTNGQVVVGTASAPTATATTAATATRTPTATPAPAPSHTPTATVPPATPTPTATVPAPTPTRTANAAVPSPTATGAAATPTPTATPADGCPVREYPWDVDGNGAVDVSDLAAIGQMWGWQGEPGCVAADVNRDGFVNISDITEVGKYWGWRAPNGDATPTPPAAATHTPVPAATATPPAAASPTPTPTVAPNAATATPTASNVPTVTATRTPTATLAPTRTPAPGATATRTPTRTATATPNPLTGNATMAISPAGSSVTVGQTFDLDVVLTADVPVRGYQFGLSFDPAVVKVNSVVEGDWLKDWAQANGGYTLPFPAWQVNNSAGTVAVGGIAIMGGSAGGPSGTGTLARINLTALAAGASIIALTSADASTPVGSVSLSIANLVVSGGQVTVNTANPTPTTTRTPTVIAGTPTPTASPSPTATLVPRATVSIDPSTKQVATGETFNVEVKVSLPDKSRGAQFGLTFNPALVKVNKVEVGGFYKNWATANGALAQTVIPFNINNSAGTVSVGGIILLGGPETEGPSGSGAIATVNLTALAPGQSNLALTGVGVTALNSSGISEHACATLHASQLIAGAAVGTPTATATAATATPTRTPTVTRTPVATMTPVATPTTLVSTTSVSVAPPARNVRPGDSFQLDIVINTDKLSRGIALGLSFDASKVRVDEIEEGPFYADWAEANGGSTLQFPSWQIDNSAGTVSVGGIAIMGGPAASGPTGSGTVAKVKLTALANGSVTVRLVGVDVSATVGDTSVTLSGVTLNHGQVTVGATAASGTPTGASGTPRPGTTARPSGGTPVAQAPGGARPGGAGAVAQAAAVTQGVGGAPGSAPADTVASAGQAAPGGPPPGSMVLAGAPTAVGQGASPVAAGLKPPSELGLATVALSAQIDEAGSLKREVRYTMLGGKVGIFLKQGTKPKKDGRPLTDIQVKPLDRPPAMVDRDLVSYAFDLGPDGARFDPPLVLSLAYEPALLPEGLEPSELTLAYFDVGSGEWVEISSKVDGQARKVTADVDHFTTFAVVSKSTASGLNWGLLTTILLAELGVAAGAYYYIVRRRRLAAASGIGDVNEFVETSSFGETVVLQLLPPSSTEGDAVASALVDASGDDRAESSDGDWRETEDTGGR